MPLTFSTVPFDPEQRRDLDHAADRDDDQDADQQQDRIAFEPCRGSFTRPPRQESARDGAATAAPPRIGPPQIVGHDQRAGEIQQAAERADDVIGVHRLHDFDEGIFQEAVVVIGAPHQALHDAGDPHRGDVEHDAEGRDPEVPLDQRVGIELFFFHSHGTRQ